MNSNFNSKTQFKSWPGNYVGANIGWYEIGNFILSAGRYEILSSVVTQPAKIAGTLIGLRLIVNGTVYPQVLKTGIDDQVDSIIHRAFLDAGDNCLVQFMFYHNATVDINVSNRVVKITRV